MLERSSACLVKGGVVLKTTKMGKLVRYYFLFSDGNILTAEPQKGGVGVAGGVMSSLRLVSSKQPTSKAL